MASSCRRFIQRSSLSSMRSAVRSAAPKSPATRSDTFAQFPLPSKSSPSPLRRLSLSRSPSELGCVQSLLPLHSVVAAARMTSCLSTTSRSCRALSQVEAAHIPETPAPEISWLNLYAQPGDGESAYHAHKK